MNTLAKFDEDRRSRSAPKLLKLLEAIAELKVAQDLDFTAAHALDFRVQFLPLPMQPCEALRHVGVALLSQPCGERAERRSTPWTPFLRSSFHEEKPTIRSPSRLEGSGRSASRRHHRSKSSEDPTTEPIREIACCILRKRIRGGLTLSEHVQVIIEECCESVRWNAAHITWNAVRTK